MQWNLSKLIYQGHREMCRIVQYVGILRCRIVQVPLYLQSSPSSICNQNMKLRKLSCPERVHLLTITICLSLLRFNRCSCSYRLTHAYHRSRSWLCQSNHLGEYPGPAQFYLCTSPWHLRIYRNIVCFWTIHCNKDSQILDQVSIKQWQASSQTQKLYDIYWGTFVW